MGTVMDRKAGAERLVREGEEFVSYWRGVGDGGPLPCCVDHEDAGGRCGRDAVMMVYDLLFCEVHGAEAKAGCLEELYSGAEQFLEFFRGVQHVRGMNPEILRVLRLGLEAAGAATWREPEFDSAELLLEAYPVIPERVDPDTSDFDYDSPGEGPYDWWRHDRLIIHMLMRLAYLEGVEYLVEILEHQREQAAAQAAFALEDLKRRYEEPRRKAREEDNE